MVDAIALTNDIVANVVGLLLPAGLWAFLFLLAWEHGPFAESIGFGRKTFWLLLPGGLLATFAILPFAPIANDVAAVSFGGAIFPLTVGALALGRVAPPLRRALPRFLACLAIEGALQLVVVLPAAVPWDRAVGAAFGAGVSGGQAGFVLAIAVAVTLAAGAGARTPPGVPGTSGGAAGAARARGSRTLPALVALTSGVLVLTFLGSRSLPGLGIEESFPFYLLPPVVAGAAAVLVARWVWPGEEGFALPIAYLATTFGVMLGADLLRQPPLYGSGPAGIYTIGGAGVLDLVYLSGPLAVLAGYAVHRALRRSLAPVRGGSTVASPTPGGRLGRAYRSGLHGQLNDSLAESSMAGAEAAGQARRLLGLPEAPPGRPWQGLPVPGWVVSDQANLDAIARAGTTDGREGYRGWLTARWLVYLGRDLGERRFGRVGDRAKAFLLDLVLLGIPGIAVWAAIVLATPGSVSALLGSLAFNAAIYGFISLAFLYLVLVEARTGSSPGKRRFGLAVRDRRLQPVGPLQALVRNVFVLPILTILGLGGALVTAYTLRSGTFGSFTLGGIALPGGLLALSGIVTFVVGGIGLLGAIGVLTIALSSERQRIGDLLAGTWVVRAAPTQVASPIPPGAVGLPPPPPGPGSFG